MSPPVAVLLYGAGKEMCSLQVPAKELSAAVGISLILYCPNPLLAPLATTVLKG